MKGDNSDKTKISSKTTKYQNKLKREPKQYIVVYIYTNPVI